MKTNVVMRVTPEQGQKVREIVLQQGGEWIGGKRRHIQMFIERDLVAWASSIWLEELEDAYEQVDAELFINTNGNC